MSSVGSGGGHDLLNNFSRAAWGHPERFLKEYNSPDVGVIEFLDFGEHFPAVRRLFKGILQPPKKILGSNLDRPLILVRNEYHIALASIQGDMYQFGAFVIGQPGIGKTFFLVYLMVYFLGQKHPVALQLSDTLYAFLDEAGASFHPTQNIDPLLDQSSFVWVLCDSNQENVIPSSNFLLEPDHMRVVQSTSPKSYRWKEWSKQVGAERFVMDIWSEEEVKKLATLLYLDVKRLTMLAEKWGGVPRRLLEYYPKPDGLVEKKYRLSTPNAIQECRTVLTQATQCDLPNEAPSLFFFIRPQRDFRDVEPYAVVPTRTIRCFLAEGLQQADEAVRLQFLQALSAPSETRQAAGFIYESWFHSFLTTEDKVLECHWIVSGSQGGVPQKLQSTTTVISATQDSPASWTPPLYWVPSVRNFPGIDSALILGDEIFAFQVSIAKKRSRSSPASGLSGLCKLLPERMKGLSWNLVFVGEDQEPLIKFAQKYAHKIFFPTNDACVRVGWSVVNPVKHQVIYRDFRDETDLALEETMEVDQ